MINREDSLAKTSKNLMLSEPYYGFFLIMLNKVWDNKRVPTAGVSKHNINYQLTINEDFWSQLSEDHRLGLIKHELLHIAFGHLTMYFKFSDKKLANWAMDCEINQYILPHLLPEGGVNIDDYPDLNLDRKAGCRYYYEKLQQAKEKKDKGGENGTSGDENFDKVCDQMDSGDDMGSDHPTWSDFEDMTEAEQKLIEKQLNKILNDAKEMTEKKRGSVPGEIEGLLEMEAITPPKFDWKGYIRRFTGVSSKVYTKKIRRKENRRYSENPGLKIKMKQHMLLAIDTSQSVCDKELHEFMNEIHHIYKQGVDITIVQCDTAIKSIEPYKGKNEITIYGRGGTEFSPVLEYYNENIKKFTSLVYFTDGECYTDVKPKAPVLWVLSEQSHMNNSLPGKVIKLEL